MLNGTVKLLGSTVLATGLMSPPALAVGAQNPYAAIDIAADQKEIDITVDVDADKGGITVILVTVTDEDGKEVSGLRVCLQRAKQTWQKKECRFTASDGVASFGIPKDMASYRINIKGNKQYEGLTGDSFRIDKSSRMRNLTGASAVKAHR